MSIDPFARVVGQAEAVAQLRAAARSPVHAYLIVGPRGSGARDLALGFAASVLAADAEPQAADRHVRLAVRAEHPDVTMIVPEGQTLRAVEAQMLIREASRSPVEASRKVIVCDRFDTAEPKAVGSLLKTIEEPPARTIVVLLAEQVLPEHVTVASRCITIELGPVSDDDLRRWVEANDVAAADLDAVVDAARGDVDRARLLLDDPALVERRATWHALPERLDGTGATVARLVDELRTHIDAVQAPLAERQEVERDELAEREDRLGTRGSGAAELTARHKREARLLRRDELRFGLATLAGRYRELLVDGDVTLVTAALAEIRSTYEALERNPIEPLLLQRLLLRLPPVSA